MQLQNSLFLSTYYIKNVYSAKKNIFFAHTSANFRTFANPKCTMCAVQREMERNPLTIDLLDARLEGSEFDFELDDAVFQQIDGLVTKGTIHAHVVCKQARQSGYVFEIHSEGVVCVPCDRCLADVKLRIDTTDELTVRLGDTYEDDGDVLTVPEKEGLLDISLPIYEFVVLSMPIRRIHEPGKCDNAMMEVFDDHQAARSSREGEEEGDSTRPNDSRWDALKQFTIKN